MAHGLDPAVDVKRDYVGFAVSSTGMITVYRSAILVAAWVMGGGYEQKKPSKYGKSHGAGTLPSLVPSLACASTPWRCKHTLTDHALDRSLNPNPIRSLHVPQRRLKDPSDPNSGFFGCMINNTLFQLPDPAPMTLDIGRVMQWNISDVSNMCIKGGCISRCVCTSSG